VAGPAGDATRRVLEGRSCPRLPWAAVSLCVASDGSSGILTSTNPTGGASPWTRAESTGPPRDLPGPGPDHRRHRHHHYRDRPRGRSHRDHRSGQRSGADCARGNQRQSHLADGDHRRDGRRRQDRNLESLRHHLGWHQRVHLRGLLHVSLGPNRVDHLAPFRNDGERSANSRLLLRRAQRRASGT
jgi:hypothetical protein